VKRRDLVAGLAIGPMGAAGGQQRHERESLYIPAHHRVEDRRLLHDFMDEFPFVELVTSSPEIRVTHIPVLLDRSAGKYGTLHGHIARQNPQGAAFDGRQPAVIVFRGPHSYISPTWYAKSEVVPTWNFAAVHASGKLKPVTDKEALYHLVLKLVQRFENHEGPRYDLGKLPDSYKFGMLAGIIGFEMEIERLEGKFKLGQERSEADREGILRNLRSAKPERSLHDLTASYYERIKTPDKSGR